MPKLAQQASESFIFNLINKLKKLKNDGFMGRTLFIKGGAYNAAIARMMLAVALWYTIELVGLAGNWDYYCIALKAFGWTPKGLVKILDHFMGEIPSQDFIVSLYQLSKISIIMMFLGLFSRVSTIVAALSSTLFASLMCSFGPYWSYAFNVELLAVLAFMFGRSGDVLSLDALINKYIFGRKDLKGRFEGRYWWPMLFAELATHMFMFAAFFQKMKNSNGLWWALSDNLRNSLAVSCYGFKNPSFRVLARRNVRETPAEVEPTELAGQWKGKRFYIKSTKNSDSSFLYTLIEVTDPVLGIKELYAGPENFQGYR